MRGVIVYLILQLGAVLGRYSGVQTIITDVSKAKRIIAKKSSIWEAVPPTDDFFVLGQYFQRRVHRPTAETELIVGRSEDGSLAEPLDFYGSWHIHHDFILWTMQCPSGFVSLGAIATPDHAKPKTSRYRCVNKKETKKAQLWETIGSTNHHALRTIYSPYGWRNNFFLVEYKDSVDINTTAYTLKTGPLKDDVIFNNINATAYDESGNHLHEVLFSKTQETADNRKTQGVKSYIVLIISGGFILFIIVIIAILFCFKTNQFKMREFTTASSTCNTFVDSTIYSGAYASSSESSVAASNTSSKGARTHSRSEDRHEFMHTTHNISRNIPHRLPNTGYEMRANVLYHSIQQAPLIESEYETIGGDHAKESLVMQNQSETIYSFAT